MVEILLGWNSNELQNGELQKVSKTSIVIDFHLNQLVICFYVILI